MRSQFLGIVGGVALSLSFSGVATAAMTDSQVARVVESLRQVGVQSPKSEGLHSDWRVKATNIPIWAKSCLGKPLTPQQFNDSPATARNIINCVIKDVAATEDQQANGDEALTVRRIAAWWMTGDSNLYNSAGTAAYTNQVLSLYQQQATGKPQGSPTDSTKPTGNTKPTDSSTSSSSSGSSSSADKTVKVPAGRSTAYDRYMQVGYTATQKRNHRTALLFFRRALDERPNDTYAIQAIKNVEAYLAQNKGGTPSPTPSPSETPQPAPEPPKP
ncbi:hypothetical protein [Alkalinema sp. FACHB-956]|uniref:hypothetical protein n=1 Tax=Alkalinema sp. FACHB-956 TaxID=2692768 RepID=UPI001685F86F|nr:hypothetical protein [Alkalinema sp. FACHB-956]MBD2328295.1 hypothetical protein [Alkalinema sp. FACHB-956]